MAWRTKPCSPCTVCCATSRSPPSSRNRKRPRNSTLSAQTDFVYRNGTTLSHLRNMRQHVKICGLGYDAFDRDAAVLNSIHTMFRHHIHDRTVNPIDFVPYEGKACIQSHARYFTDRDLVPHEMHHQYVKGVDPHNILRDIQPSSFIHGPDNVVEYCRREERSNGSFTCVYTSIFPTCTC